MTVTTKTKKASKNRLANQFSDKPYQKILSLVLKADTAGTKEAVIAGFDGIRIPGVKIEVFHAATGNISKSDLLMAETGSRIIVGFDVDIHSRITRSAVERGIEIRLYDIIYTLINDIRVIASTLTFQEKEEENLIDTAEVIALFKGGDKGIILGCRVQEGKLRVGDRFRIISDRGPVYACRIGSLHIEDHNVKEAVKGQQAGLKIPGFKRAKKGDIVECYKTKTLIHTLKKWRKTNGSKI